MSEEQIKKMVFLQILAGMCILCFISVFYSFSLISSLSYSTKSSTVTPATAKNMDSIEETTESKTIISEIYQKQQAMPVSFSFMTESISTKLEEKIAGSTSTNDPGLAFYRDISNRNSVIQFYTQITGSSTITDAILTYASKNDIPLSLAFSLAWGESRYKPNAINTNSNTSIDRGLFQLNSSSFPKIAEKDFYDPYVSARYGLAHLSFCIQTAGNEVAGLAMYNAGTVKVKKDGTPRHTLNYINGILNYRNMLDELFEQEVVKKAKTPIFIAKINQDK
ncbi:MAG: transglycosylase SLT domain-containing protein [Treponemataceae bacterium]|nr:transglycosylase SLT domain-containing protein [Treponemataceae bacterium]